MSTHTNAASIQDAKPEEISAKLQGLERINQMEVDPSSHHYITLSVIQGWLRERAWNVVHGVMLDYGCGGQPYRNFFAPRITQYIGADVAAAKGAQLDIQIIPDQRLSLPDSSIDTVLSTETIEHVAHPDFYFAECNRLLKPGGVLVLTVPMQWRIHEAPYDFWRYTYYGLIHLLTKHGFTIKDLSPAGGAYALIGQVLLNHLNTRGVKNRFLFRQINRLALWLDRKSPDLGETHHWMCIAIKEPAP